MLPQVMDINFVGPAFLFRKWIPSVRHHKGERVQHHMMPSNIPGRELRWLTHIILSGSRERNHNVVASAASASCLSNPKPWTL